MIAQAKPQVDPPPLLRPGLRGWQVKRLQKLLSAAGEPVGVDGQFGSGTQHALIAFQKAKNLTAVYKLLAKKRKSLHLQQAYWFTWLTYDKAHDNHFDYAGVLHLGANGSIKPKPAYKALGKVALGLEGCTAKASFADSCAP